MKLFSKLLITALVLSVLLPFTILKGKDGKPLMSISDIKLPTVSLPEFPDVVKNTGLIKNSASTEVIYKWKDQKGALHFSSSPPPEGVEYTSKGYDPNTNLIQSVDTKVNTAEKTNSMKQPIINKTSDIGNPYSPTKVDKLIKDAKNIEKLLNDRLQKQEALLD